MIRFKACRMHLFYFVQKILIFYGSCTAVRSVYHARILLTSTCRQIVSKGTHG